MGRQAEQEMIFYVKGQPALCLKEPYQALLDGLQEVLEHGYGKIEVCIQDRKVVNFQVTKSFK